MGEQGDAERKAGVALLSENLRLLVPLLLGFVGAAVTAWLSFISLPYRVAAALFTLAAIIATLLWLQLPWARWRSHRARRLQIVASLLVLAGVALGIGWVQRPPVVDHALPVSLIVVDTSAHMADAFGDDEEAIADLRTAIVEWARPASNDQLGLVTFGTDRCGEPDPVQEHVPIAADRLGEVTEALDRLELGGTANLVAGGRFALGMLNDFESDGNRVVVFTAGLDGCGDDLRDLIREQERRSLALEWRLVGIGLDEDAQAELGEFDDLGDVHLVDTPAELQEVVRFLMYEEPVRAEFERLLSFVEDDVRVALNDALSAAGSRDPEEARDHLDRVRETAAFGEERFSAFTDRGIEEFDPIVDVLRLQFDRLQEAADRLEGVVDFDEQHGADIEGERIRERNDLLGEVNEVVRAYNGTLRELSTTIQDTLDRLFASGDS